MRQLVKRLEIRVDAEHLKTLEEEANRQRKPVSQIVRDAIDACYPAKKRRVKKKLKAFEELGELRVPAPEWKKMKEEIHKGLLT